MLLNEFEFPLQQSLQRIIMQVYLSSQLFLANFRQS